MQKLVLFFKYSIYILYVHMHQCMFPALSFIGTYMEHNIQILYVVMFSVQFKGDLMFS